MTIFDKDKISFVHPPRCGGASMRVAILNCGYPEQRFFYGNYSHQPAFEMRHFAAWKDSYKFTIVRNPWSRMVSMWNALFVKKLDRFPEYLPQLSVKDAEFLGKQTARQGFKLFLKNFNAQVWNYPQSYPTISPGQAMNSVLDPQMCWLTENGKTNGEVELDDIFRFEDMPAIYEHLGVEPDKIKGWTPYADGSYMDYYDDESRDIIAKRFEPDIRRLGYEFEGPEFPHVGEDSEEWKKQKELLKG